jgi:hypothetical protein
MKTAVLWLSTACHFSTVDSILFGKLITIVLAKTLLGEWSMNERAETIDHKPNLARSHVNPRLEMPDHRLDRDHSGKRPWEVWRQTTDSVVYRAVAQKQIP